jgi:hypothetical protein
VSDGGFAAVRYEPNHNDMRGPRCIRHGSIYVVGPFVASNRYGSPVQRWQCSRCGAQWDIDQHLLKGSDRA